MSSKELTPITITIQPGDNYLDILTSVVFQVSSQINAIKNYDIRKLYLLSLRASVDNLVEALDTILREDYDS